VKPRTDLRIALVLKTNQGGMWVLPHIAELRARGHHVVAVLPPGVGRLRWELALRGVPVIDSAFDFRFRPTWRTVAGLIGLRRQFRELRPDVLLYHLYASALATRLAAACLRVPRVHMVAGPLYLESAAIRAVERVLARLDTVTIGGSEFTSRRYRELGLPVPRTPTIPYGVDTTRFVPPEDSTRTAARAALGLTAGVFVAIMVAYVYAPKRAVHRGRGLKGHDVLLRAWSRFHAEHPDSVLLLVGGGFDEAGERHQRALAAAHGADGIAWLGTTPDVRDYYAAADVSVSPSLSDNHGAALEAGAMAVPSIVSTAGGLPETVELDSGWVVAADDPGALLSALREAHAEHGTGELAERGRAARTLVSRRFDSTRLASDVADVVERAAGRPRSAVVSVFGEARFGRDRSGRWAATDRANGGDAWDAHTMGGRVRLVVRADPRPGTGSVPLAPGVEVVPLPHYVGPAALVRRLLPLTVAVWRAVLAADVVVLRLPGVVGVIAATACRLTRRRYAVEVVGDPADVLAAGVLGRPGRWLSRPAAAQLRRVVRAAAASRFVTEDALQRRYPPRPGTLSIGLGGVRLGAEDFVAGARHRPGPPWRIVTIGSQEQRYKGHDVLLHAVRRLLDDGVDVTATVVGGGRTHDELVALAERLGLRDRVEFTGAVHDRASIMEILDSAAVFALPSRTEGLPRALLEAMARALPAVGSDVGGIPELLEPDCLARVDDAGGLAAAIGRLLADPALWRWHSRRNLDVAGGYATERLDGRFARWLAEVPLARRPGRRCPR
jgi:glycosyltransferase involved in cell wall biosynthesis